MPTRTSRRRQVRTAGTLASSAFLIFTAAAAGGLLSPVDADRRSEVVPGRYIVVLKPGRTTARSVGLRMAERMGVRVTRTFANALDGFAVEATPEMIQNLSGSGDVAYVEPDQRVTAFQKRRGGGGSTGGGTTSPPPPSGPAQTLPTGVNRVDADLSPSAAINGTENSVNATIAVIDTGIQSSHPDLNVAFSRSFTATATNGEDGHGHGTHVAGIAAARDNGVGVVGVAPGARLWALKALDNSGSGLNSDIIAALDFVTANAASVDVCNLSLGSAFSQAMNDAVERCVAAGVVVVAAAGNACVDASTYSPASAPSVLCVSALADSDGQPGRLGPITSWGADDTMAWFSNWGPAVDFIAPGVSINSTTIGSSYTQMNGTSMASPHVAGAAALFVAGQRGATGSRPSPAATRSGLTANAEQAPNGFWFNDMDPVGEPMIRAAGF